MRHRKTRRNLKRRSQSRISRQRTRKQRGGENNVSNIMSADKWVSDAVTKIQSLTDQKMDRFSELVDESLRISPPTDAERVMAKTSILPSDVTVTEDVGAHNEDFRDIGLTARTAVYGILNDRPLEPVLAIESATLADLKSRINTSGPSASTINPDMGDIATSIKYLLVRENALREKMSRGDYNEPLPISTPITTMVELLDARTPLLIWALIANTKQDAEVPAFYTQKELDSELSEPTR